MRPGPKKPGESAAEYRARVNAMEQKFRERYQAVRATPPRPGETKGDHMARVRAASGGGTPVRTMGGPADKMGPGAVKPGMPKMKAGGTVQGMQASPPAHMMSGRKDKAPPSRTAKAEIKGYLSKVAREDRETEKTQYKNLDRAMRGTESKAIKEDLRAGREDRMSKSSAPSKSPRPMRSPVKKAMGGMVKGYKDGGCVMAGRGGKYKGEM